MGSKHIYRLGQLLRTCRLSQVLSPCQAGACLAMPYLTYAVAFAGSAATSPQLLLNTGGHLHLLTLNTGSLQYEHEVRCFTCPRHNLSIADTTCFATGRHRRTGGSSHKHGGRVRLDARQIGVAQHHLHGREEGHHAGLYAMACSSTCPNGNAHAYHLLQALTRLQPKLTPMNEFPCIDTQTRRLL